MGPAEQYESRLSAGRLEQTRLSLFHGRLRRGRNVLIGLLIVLIVLAEKERWPAKLALLGVPILFAEVLTRRRDAIAGAWRRTDRSIAFYLRRLACVRGDWAGGGESGTRYLDEHHPGAGDLDLFGVGCLFERLSTARTRLGEETLATWLQSPGSVEEVRLRQGAVSELRGKLDLLEELAVLGAEVRSDEDLGRFVAWAKAPPTLAPLPRRFILLGSALAFVAFVSGFAAGAVMVLAAVLVQVVLTFVFRRQIASVLRPVEDHAGALVPLARVLARLEKEEFEAPRLRRLFEALAGPASRRLLRVGRWLARAPFAQLPLARPLAVLLAERWRDQWGPAFVGWLAALGEFEALCSLASYSFEVPGDPFPEVVSSGPCFEAEGLGHPLLPAERSVRNDVSLALQPALLIVSGSNMSGKSTLLRSVGINAVLALAGGPVRAARLRLSPVVTGATLRIQDSLQAGHSRFYAEVLRVRQLLELANGSPGLLFLLDELFQGTNSHDRRMGAEAVLRRLLSAGAVGLVTTHDLAITEIADRLGAAARNVHFTDGFEEGRMTFDYRMKPGVVQNTNGLALMRAVGIEV